MPSIRPAQLSDAAEIAALTRQLGYAADTAAIGARLESLLNADDHLVLVSCSDAKISGWMQAHAATTLESGHHVEILGLVVAEDCRRSGVGRALIQRAESWALEKKSGTLVVRSNVMRPESHRFYPALGFGVSKTQTVYHKPVLPPRPSRGHRP